jgi:hypothetical protein
MAEHTSARTALRSRAGTVPALARCSALERVRRRHGSRARGADDDGVQCLVAPSSVSLWARRRRQRWTGGARLSSCPELARLPGSDAAARRARPGRRWAPRRPAVPAVSRRDAGHVREKGSAARTRARPRLSHPRKRRKLPDGVVAEGPHAAIRSQGHAVQAPGRDLPDAGQSRDRADQRPGGQARAAEAQIA